MKFRLTALVLLSICLSNAFADEGMWLLGNLKKNKQTERVMKDLGLQMPVSKLYNPKKPCLADAVVSFGGFCSGVVVSDDGLVFTNHHCGFSSIQQHSSVEHDYLKDGFVARSLQEELPNPELYVRFLLRTEDVTKRVLSAARHAKTETERRVAGTVCCQICQNRSGTQGSRRLYHECNRNGSFRKGFYPDRCCGRLLCGK